MTVKEQYWRYSLIVLILLLGVIIFFEILPFLGGILGAMTIYVLLRGQMAYLTGQKHWRRVWAAVVMIVETILVFLIPLSLFVWLVISNLQAVNLDPHTLLIPVQHVAGLIEEKTGYDVLSGGNLHTLLAWLPDVGQVLMGSIGSFVINIVALLFILYFMLIGGQKMEVYVNDIMPFNQRNKQNILHEFHMVVRSNAIGVPLLAVLQGAVAMAGYFIFGVPAAFLWGVVSCFATIIPVVGIAIVWLPLVLYMGALDEWSSAIGLTVYCVVIVTNIDNLIRTVLQKKMADTHPLITIFGVIIGLSLFGFMGVIFGPLLLAIFMLCVKFFKEEYLDVKP